MKIITWNVNGLRAVYKKGFLNFLSNNKADILCLQETKVLKEQLTEDQLFPLNYQFELAPAEKKGYSGVGTFYQKSLKYKTTVGINNKKYDSEGRFLLTHINGIDIYNIYFPSGSSGEIRQKFKYEFLDDFFAYLQKLPKSRLEKIILCGDFNICHKNIDIHHPDKARKAEMSGFLPDEQKWLDELCELGFVDTYRELHPNTQKFSWWSYRANARNKNLGWRIDYFFISKKLLKKVKKAEILTDITGSDHCPVLLEIDI